MIISVTELPDSLDTYLSSYADILSKPQQAHFQTYVTGLMVCEGKRTVTNINATRLPGERKDDTSLSRFVNQLIVRSFCGHYGGIWALGEARSS